MALIFTRKFIVLTALWLLISAVVLGVTASCGGEDGMYQGPGDSQPGWRR